MSGPRIGELFAGYGGLGMGVQRAIGGEIAWVSEFDKGANKILAHRFPDVPNHGDITKIDWQTVEPVDVLTGGFPCQDLSHAGNRLGMVNGSRSNLWHEFVRAIAHLQPKLVVIENVRGLLSGSAEFDEPDDTCVCGWPYRRGGMRTDSGESWSDVSPSRDGGDDGEGAGSAGGHAVSVRRANQDGACCDGEVGCGLCVDGGGSSSHRSADLSAAVSDPQGRAGTHRVEGGSDPIGASAALAVLAERTATVDGRGAGAVRHAEEADARTEREGAEPGAAYDVTTGRRITHCEACGGDLGDRPSRSVERSWMGIVQRELARIGFDAQWRGLRAADVGAPHGRFRVFVTAWPAADAGQGGRGRWAPELAGSPDHVAGSGARPGTLLPTPRTSDTNGAGAHGEGGVDLRTAVTLLPTPACNDMGEGKTVEAWDEWTAKMQAAHGNGNGHGKSLSIEAQRLLPTPQSQDAKGHLPGNADARIEQGRQLQLGHVVGGQDWGIYADAIARWEALTRPAPAPTQPSKKGTPQLSAAFSEWLMGLPAGWVTDVPGITRNEALKALGNGVVAQQCEAALRLMLGHLEVAA